MRKHYYFIAFAIWIAACLFLFHVFYQGAKDTAIADLNARQMIHARQAATGIEAFFGNWISALTRTANRESIITLNGEGKRQMAALLGKQEQWIRGVKRLDAQGRLVYALPHGMEIIGTDLSREEHVREVIRTRRPVISSVYHSLLGFPAVALHVPVFKDNNFRGSIAILLDFSLIAEHYLDDIAIGKTGYAWMVDRKGIELYCPVPGHSGKSVFDNHRNNPTLLAMAEEMVKGRQGVTTYLYLYNQIRGQAVERVKKHAVYLPAQIADSHWSIVVATSEEEVVASLAGLRNRLLAVLAILLFGSLVFSYYAMKSWAIVREEKKRRKAERELRESQARFESLFLSMNEGMALHELCLDAEGRPTDYVLLDVNRAFERIFGISREKAVGQRGSALFGIEPAPSLDRYARVARTGEPSHFETTDAAPGKVLLVSVFSPTQGQFATVFEDITAQKEAEAKLRLGEERYRELYDEAPVGYHEIDREGRIVQINKRELEMLGYSSAEELLGRAAWDLAVEPEEATVRAILAGEVSPDTSSERTYRRRDGTTVPVQVYSRPIQDQEGRIVGMRSTVQDIRERKRTEAEKEKLQAQLLQAQKMEAVGRLAGGVAHDFNNMLGVIIGHTELASLRVDPGSPAHKSLEAILKTTLRSADLVRQLLAFARKQTIAPSVLDLNATVENMLDMFRRLLGEEIALDWVPGKGLCPVRMDPTQIHQILANLLVNSRDAIAGIGTITLETDNVVFDESYCRQNEGAVPGIYVRVTLSDTGCGMGPEVMAHLFDPFFTTKELGKGTGLGLATIYGIVKQNSGFINVYSEPGLGSTFKIYIPCHATGEVEPAPAVAAMPSTGTETILVVEDEESLLDIARINLEGMGYRVLAAQSPRQALAIAEGFAGEIHLLLTDVVMPEMNGRELLERLRPLRPAMRCLFMSGYTANVIVHRGVLDEDVSFLPKPFSSLELGRKVRETLDRADRPEEQH